MLNENKSIFKYSASDLIDWQVTKEANEEILEIEQNYMEKRKPVYKRRHKIISEIPEFWRSVVSRYIKLFSVLYWLEFLLHSS